VGGEGEESPQPHICDLQVTWKKLTISSISIAVLNKMIESTWARAISRAGRTIRTAAWRHSFVYKKARSDEDIGKHESNPPKSFKVELVCSEPSPSLSEDPFPVEELP
jgi:hypothetical protein